MRLVFALAAIALFVAIPGMADDPEILARSHGYYVTGDLVLHHPDGSTTKLPGERPGWGAVFTPSGRYLIYPSWYGDGSGCNLNSFNLTTGTLAAILSHDCNQPGEQLFSACRREGNHGHRGGSALGDFSDLPLGNFLT